MLHVILGIEWGDLYCRAKIKIGRFTSVNGILHCTVPGEDFEEFTVG